MFRRKFKLIFFVLFSLIVIDFLLIVKEKNSIIFLNKNYKYKSEDRLIVGRKDSNEDSFDELVNAYCNVNLINVSSECLKRLEAYNTSKIEFVFNRDDGVIYFHTFWQPIKSKGHHLRVMKLNILSYLATQNLKKTKLIVWSLEKLEVEDDIKSTFKQFVNAGILQFRLINLEKLCVKGVFGLRYKYCTRVTNSNFILLSDFIRFLVLYNFGGIYFDGDVILLRDMIPFWDQTFVYRWSFTHSYNTAVMGLQVGYSKEIEYLFQILVMPAMSAKNLVDTFYPERIRDTIEQVNASKIYNFKDLNVYNSVLFDPAWLCFDSGMSPTDNIPLCSFPGFYDFKISKADFKMEKFFPGAFAYHLHLSNCGSCTISNQSYFYHVENYFYSIINRDIKM